MKNSNVIARSAKDGSDIYIHGSVPLILVHIGPKPPPEYAYDCLYQVIAVAMPVMIYFVTNHTKTMAAVISQLDIEDRIRHRIKVIDAAVILHGSAAVKEHFIRWSSPNGDADPRALFRDGFWINTTARFFYLAAAMDCLDLKTAFHVENDILMILPFETIMTSHDLWKFEGCGTDCVGVGRADIEADPVPTVLESPKAIIYSVKDAPNRVVPSIVYLNQTAAVDLCRFIADFPQPANDMEILAAYGPLRSFRYDPYPANYR